MAITGNGCFVAWYDLKPGHDAEHDFWHTHEHMIERVAIPGFRRGFRYRSLEGSPQVCVIYHGESVETFGSPAYMERLNAPTPWTSRNLPIFVGMNRTLAQVEGSFGHGIGSLLATIRLAPATDGADRLRQWLNAEVLPAFAARAGVCGAHLLRADRGVSGRPTAESTLRGVPDAVADWVVLIEGYDRAVVASVLAELTGAAGLGAHGAEGSSVSGLYRLEYTLGEDEAKRLWRLPAG